MAKSLYTVSEPIDIVTLYEQSFNLSVLFKDGTQRKNISGASFKFEVLDYYAKETFLSITSDSVDDTKKITLESTLGDAVLDLIKIKADFIGTSNKAPEPLNYTYRLSYIVDGVDFFALNGKFIVLESMNSYYEDGLVNNSSVVVSFTETTVTVEIGDASEQVELARALKNQTEAFKNQASTSAANALVSEQHALTSEQHALTSEQNALDSANLASQKADLIPQYLGTYNVATNTPTLNQTPTNGLPNGSYYVVTVGGNIGFAGNNFTSGTTFNIGDKLSIKGNRYDRIPFEIADNSIIPEKLQFIGKSKNLANPSTFTDNFFLENDNTAIANSSYGYTDYIPVTAGLAYSGSDGVNGMRKTCYYNASKQLVAGGSTNAITTFTVPSGVAFVRVTYYTIRKTSFQFEQASTPTSFVQYNYLLNVVKIDAKDVIESSLKRMISDADYQSFINKVNKSDIGYIEGKNKYDGGYVVDSLVINTTGAFTFASGFVRTTSQAVLPNQQYTLSGINYITFNSIAIRFEDSNNNLISYISNAQGGVTGYPVTFTTPSNCAYVVFTIRHSSNSGVAISTVISTIQLEKGAIVTSYVPYTSAIYILSILGVQLPVLGVAGKKGDITLYASDIVGLQTALDTKLNIADITIENVGKSKNLANPSTFTDNFFLENDNTAIAYSSYGYTDYIPVTAGLAYSGSDGVNGMRKTCYYNASKQLVAGGSTNAITTFTVPSGVAFVRVTYYTIRKTSFQFEQASTPTSFVQYNAGIDTITKILGYALAGSNSNTTSIDTITFELSDKIQFEGCSYLESLYSLKGKSYIQKLASMTDWNIGNRGVAGSRMIDIVDRLRANTSVFGIIPKSFKPTYIFLGNNGNEYFPSNGETLDLYLEQFKIAIEQVQALGAKSILGTDYHTNTNVWLESNLQEFAKRRKIPYIGIGTYGSKMMSNGYLNFWVGSHPGLRVNSFISNELNYFISQLPRPRKGLKIYRNRNTISAISELNYDTIEQRQERFIELCIGETYLNTADSSESYYDRLNEGTIIDPNNENNTIPTFTTQNNNNEYVNLLSGSNIAFSNYALVEIISEKLNLSTFEIKIKGDVGLTFYAKNNNDSSTYSTDEQDKALVFQVSKTVFDSFADSVGTLFTSAGVKSGTVQFAYKGKLKSYSMGKGWFLCFTAISAVGQGDRVVNTTSITRVSNSTTVTTINQKSPYRYSYPFFANMNQPKGAWNILTAVYNAGEYTITLSTDFAKYFQFDKFKLLISKTGNFNISSVITTSTGGIIKPETVVEIEQKLGGLELNAIRGFDSNWTTTGGWTANNNNLVSMPSTVRDYPPYLSNINHVELGLDSDGFSQKISKSFTFTESRGFRKLSIRVVARVFPLIYNPSQSGAYFTNTPVITKTSFDLGVLCAGLRKSGSSNPVTIMRKMVDIGWQELVFETTIPPFETGLILDLWRDCELDKNLGNAMQIFDVSLQIL